MVRRPWPGCDTRVVDRLTAPHRRPDRPRGGLLLLGLAERRLDLVLSLALLALLALSRLAAFPASIWEQDEAYFSAAVVALDVSRQHPQPPWCPLWIRLGRLVRACGAAPAASLQLVSLAFAVWLPLPLVALWRRLLPEPGLAVGSAVLVAAAPVVWLLSGRAFAGTAATALTAAALACWVADVDLEGDRRRPAVGSLLAALAVLVRPQLAPPLVVAGLLVARRRAVGWRRVVLPGVAVVALGGLAFAIAAGGPGALWRAAVGHAAYHFSRLGEVDRSLAASGLARGLGHPAAALAWLAAAAVGAVVLLRRPTTRAAATVVVAALATLLAETVGLANAAHPRYWVPVLALSAGLVVAAAEAIRPRLGVLAVVVASVWSAAVVGPQLAAYRSRLSPPLAALRFASARAAAERIPMVVDRSLVAFVDAERVAGRLAVPVLFDHLLEGGVVAPPETAVAVFDDGHGELVAGGVERRVFRCDPALACRLSQGRFLAVTVVDGARFLRPPVLAGGAADGAAMRGGAVAHSGPWKNPDRSP